MKSHWIRLGTTRGVIPAATCLVALTLVSCAEGPARNSLNLAPSTQCNADETSLAAAARREGSVTVIGMDRDWANTGEILKQFTASTGIQVNSLYPLASSAESLTVLRTWQRNVNRPDVAEVSISAAETAQTHKLLSPLTGATWQSLPARFKDETGEWSASFLGVIAFGVNSAAVPNTPNSWQELLKPEFHEAVTLNGDPRESGTALATVMAAGMANGGSLDDVSPGVAFFAELSRRGNLNPLPMTHLNVAYGDVPIALAWNYAIGGLSTSVASASTTLATEIPADGVIGVPYAQVISRRAPHPCAARLLIDYLNGKEAATQRMLVGAVPVAHWDEAAKNPLTADVVKALEVGGLDTHVPTAEQLMTAQETVDQDWFAAVVSADKAVSDAP